MEEMKKDTYMYLEVAKDYGFITDIVDTIKAVAKVSVNNNKMEDKKEKKTKWEQLVEFFNGLDNEKIENVTIKSAQGKDVVFTERTTGEVQVGDKATIEGENASGEVLMASGDTYVFENGELKEINEKQEVDVAALIENSVKAAIKPLEDKIDSKDEIINSLKTSNEELKKSNEKMLNAYNGLKGIVSESSADDTKNEHKTIDKSDDTPKNVLSLNK